MIKYLVSVVLFLFVTISAIILADGVKYSFLSLHDFIFVWILPFLFVCILFGFKEMCSAFSTAFRKNVDKGQILNAINFFKMYGITIWITCLISILINIINILENGYYDLPQIRFNSGFLLITLFHTAIINILVIIPFTMLLKKQLKE